MTSIRIASIRIAFAAALAAVLFTGGTAHAGHSGTATRTHMAVVTAMGASSSSPVLCCDEK
jgi:hypothetical protein